MRSPRWWCRRQIPALIFVSERGTLGEFNLGQAMVCKTMRPVLDSLGVENPHHHAPGRARLHRRPLDQAGGGDAGAGHLHPVAAVDRRQSVRGVAMTTTQTGAVGAHNAKVMNRFDLTKRLVGQLKHDEAVIGGIGNANFDLWASGQRPQNFYMLGSMGLDDPDRLRRRHRAAAAARDRARGRRLAADAARLPRHRRHAGAEESHHGGVGQRHLPDHRRRSRRRALGRRSGRHRARPPGLRQQRLGRRRGRLRPLVRGRAQGRRAEPDRRAHRQQAGRSAPPTAIRCRFARASCGAWTSNARPAERLWAGWDFK